MKVLIVSGFLGAGKTTFIKELTKHAGCRIAVLENEYGASGIDGDILKNGEQREKLDVWEMTEGCICCSMKRDFAASVLTIANTLEPDCLIVEPTGVGMLSSVVYNIQQVEYDRISLLSPIAVVDGNSYQRYLAEYPQIYKDQIAAAHTIVVSKMEQADASMLAWLEKELRELNPKAEIFTDHYSKQGKEFWSSLFQRRYDGTSFVEIVSDQTALLPDSFSLNFASMDCPERLFLLAEGLIHGCYGNIFRAKGTIEAKGHFFQFDVADGRYSICGTAEKSRKAVFIGTGIKRKQLEAFFQRPKRMGQNRAGKVLSSPTRCAPHASL